MPIHLMPVQKKRRKEKGNDERDLEFIYDVKPRSRFHKFVYPQTLDGGKVGAMRLRPMRGKKKKE